LESRVFYRCNPCDAYVGCHPGTDKPLGSLANRNLRNQRQQAHAVFDRIWKEGFKTRSQAYTWLGKKLKLTWKQFHIALFDEATCQKVIQLSQDYLKTKEQHENHS
jgi:hypothetical protein